MNPRRWKYGTNKVKKKTHNAVKIRCLIFTSIYKFWRTPIPSLEFIHPFHTDIMWLIFLTTEILFPQAGDRNFWGENVLISRFLSSQLVRCRTCLVTSILLTLCVCAFVRPLDAVSYVFILFTDFPRPQPDVYILRGWMRALCFCNWRFFTWAKQVFDKTGEFFGKFIFLTEDFVTYICAIRRIAGNISHNKYELIVR